MLDSATLAPVPGAAVIVKGTTRGISTDAEGRYTMNIEGLPIPLTLTFASIGYHSEERLVRDAGVAIPDVVMRPDLAQLNDIVVVGGCGIVRPWWHPLRWYSTLRIKTRNLISR
ncbi:carboxypeptidase-like regulatory domain-containing protein [Solirubrum puertoriconensis]|uniref:carboxypeptidase-like regulatory domain-containing protein n=1 Tax=Solirubrum puertoriconensis TaxID=1751427 RepID=UPI0013666412